MGFLRDLFAQKGVQPKNELPPPYNPNNDSKPIVNEKLAQTPRGPRNYVLKKEVIKATDPPKWLWNTTQCREWLLDLYTNHLQMNAQDAKVKSEAFDGCGSTLYIATAHEWTWMLGRNAGAGVYGMLYGFRSAEGAVPKDVSLRDLRGSLKKGLETRERKDFENISIAIWGGRDKPFVEETKDTNWDADSIWNAVDKVANFPETEDANKLSSDSVTKLPLDSDTFKPEMPDMVAREPKTLIATASDDGQNGNVKSVPSGTRPH